MATILLIDDDEDLGDAMTMYLEGFNHQLVCTPTPSEGFAQLQASHYDLMLLDIMLPEQDGFSVCRQIRGTATAYQEIPIIMLTARGDVTDRVVGLELGADDYLPKPFEPRELLARINSILRRQANNTVPVATSPPTTGLHINDALREAHLDGQLLELSTMEFELLHILSKTPGKKWSRDELTSKLRGTNAELYSRAVDTLISRLRHRLRDDSANPRFIKTIWGYGYYFLGTD